MQMLGQRFLSKVIFSSPIKPGIMETPPASQQDKQMPKLTFVAFLLASHLGLSVEQWTLKLTKIYDSVSKNGILRTKVCSASANKVRFLALQKAFLHCLFDYCVCLCIVCIVCIGLSCLDLYWSCCMDWVQLLWPSGAGWVKSQKVALLPRTYIGATWLKKAPC